MDFLGVASNFSSHHVATGDEPGSRSPPVELSGRVVVGSIAISLVSLGLGASGLAADEKDARMAASGWKQDEGETTFRVDPSNSRLEFRHRADRKLTHADDSRSRPESGLESRPPRIDLIDLEGHLAVTGANLANVEAQKRGLGGIRELTDLDIDRLRRTLSIEDQGHQGAYVQSRSQDSQLRRIRNVVVGQLHDHIPALQPADRGRAARLNPRNQDTMVVGKPQLARSRRQQGR